MANEENITLGQLLDFAQKADERLDALEGNRAKGQAVTLASGSWTNNSGDTKYPYQYRLTVTGVTTASRADLVLDDASAALAASAGMSAATNTAANTVIFKSRTAPGSNLTGTLYVAKAVTMNG